MTTPYPEDFRDEVERNAREIFARLVHTDAERKLCLYWAAATCRALRNQDIKAFPIAGTANWLANNEPEPTPTHIGHFWQDHCMEVIEGVYLSRGVLPEIHCWTFIPSSAVIVDPTTKWVKELAQESGIPWTKPDPPDCFWGTELPYGWMYEPSASATCFAFELIRSAAPFLLDSFS